MDGRDLECVVCRRAGEVKENLVPGRTKRKGEKKSDVREEKKARGSRVSGGRRETNDNRMREGENLVPGRLGGKREGKMGKQSDRKCEKGRKKEKGKCQNKSDRKCEKGRK